MVGIALSLTLGSAGTYRFIYSKYSDETLWTAATKPKRIISLGVIVGLGTIGYGLWVTRDKRGKDSIHEERGVHIVAKTSFNNRGEHIMNPEDHPAGSLTHVIRVALANGRRAEFKCDDEKFRAIPEGVVGDLAYQGHWVRGFRIGARPPHEGE